MNDEPKIIPINFLEQFFEQSKEAVLILGQDAEIIYCNNYIQEIFELQKDSILNKKITEIFAKFINPENSDYLNTDFIEGLYNNLLNVTSINQKPITSEYILHFEGNRTKHIFVIFYPLASEDGHFIGVLIREDKSNKLLRLNLEYRKNFEKLVSEIAYEFVNLETYELEDKITNALKKLCQFANADGTVFYLTRDFKIVPEYVYFLNSLQINTDKFKEKFENIHSWIYKVFQTRNFISDNLLLYDEATDPQIRKYMKMLGLSNLLLIPVSHQNDILGCIAIFNAMLDSSWHREDTSLMKTFCDILVSGIDRVNKQLQLKKELQINQTIANISNLLLEEHSLQKIAEIILYSVTNLFANTFSFLCLKNLDEDCCVLHHDYLKFNDDQVQELDKAISNNFASNEIHFKNFEKPISIKLNTSIVTVENYLFVPISIFNSNFGFIFLANKVPKFTNYELTIISRIASIFAIDLNRHIIKKKLRSSEEKYHTLLENTSSPIFVMKDHKFLFVNNSFCKLIGYNRDEILSPAFDYFSILDELSRETVRQQAIEALNGKKISNSFEIQAIKKNGELINAVIDTISLNEPCNFHYFIGIVHDITAKKRYQKIISRRDEILEAISQAAEQFLIDTNWRSKIKVSLDKLIHITDSSVVYFFQIINVIEKEKFSAICLNYSVIENFKENICFETDKEYSFEFDEDVLNKLYSGDVVVINQADFFANSLKCLQDMNYKSLTIIPIIPYNQFWGFFLIRSIETEHNWIPQEIDAFKIAAKIYAAAIINEQNEIELKKLNSELEERVRLRTAELEDALDELRKAKEELQEAYTREKEFSELRAKFLSVISQEYRSPLTVVLTSIFLMELALSKNDIQTIAKHIERIRLSARQMSHLLDNVLTTGQLDEKDFADERHFVPFDIKKLLEKIVDDLKAIDQNEHKFHISINLKNYNVISDENLMKSIFNNLLSNAMLYTPAYTDIYTNISLNEDNRLEIIIKDNGYGIPEQDLKHLFNPFYRGENASGTQGSGLGLHIVKNAVDKLNGLINVDSQIGVGTTFTIILPCVFLHQ